MVIVHAPTLEAALQINQLGKSWFLFGALQEHREKQRQQLTAPGESKREARRVELALRPPACERTARDSQDSEIAGAAHSATLEPHAR